MPLDSGIFVLVCALFFVFLALLKQNVLIFVSQNLDGRNMSQEERALFAAYDLDYNGVIDQDEFLIIAANVLPRGEDHDKSNEPDLDETYINILTDFKGNAGFPAVNKETQFTISTFSLFIPKVVELGYSWVLYEGIRTPITAYYATPIRPVFPHYPIYQLFSEIHRNAVLDTHFRTPVSSALVTGISDSHFRVNFVISVEFQLAVPLDQPSWAVLCDPCESETCDKSECEVAGEAIFTLDTHLLEYFLVKCGGVKCSNPGNNVKIENQGGAYRYKIHHNKVVTFPVGQEVGVSYKWHQEVENWMRVLNESNTA